MLKRVEEIGLGDRIRIESAGTAAYHVGERADPRSRNFARRRGISLESRARKIGCDDLETQDFILAMDKQNLSDLISLKGDSPYAGHLSLLRDFDPLAPDGAEVPDPYYGGDAGFEEVLDLCDAACQGLIETLCADRKFE
jgi:protein-tyrosine phosphatase